MQLYCILSLTNMLNMHPPLTSTPFSVSTRQHRLRENNSYHTMNTMEEYGILLQLRLGFFNILVILKYLNCYHPIYVRVYICIAIGHQIRLNIQLKSILFGPNEFSICLVFVSVICSLTIVYSSPCVYHNSPLVIKRYAIINFSALVSNTPKDLRHTMPHITNYVWWK